MSVDYCHEQNQLIVAQQAVVNRGLDLAFKILLEASVEKHASNVD